MSLPGWWPEACSAVQPGSVWCWEPLKPNVREDGVKVVECVVNEAGEPWVITESPSGKCWNELSRFVEACVLVAAADGES